MKLISKLCAISLLVLVLKSTLIFAQSLVISSSINIDSVFCKFEYPVLSIKESTLDNYAISSIHVTAYCQIDTNGFVSRIIINPLYDIGNNMSMESVIWKEVEKSIIRASKNWIFKPFNYTILDMQSGDSLASKDAAINRPFGGRQAHLIVFSLYLSDSPIHNRLYEIDVFGAFRFIPETE